MSLSIMGEAKDDRGSHRSQAATEPHPRAREDSLENHRYAGERVLEMMGNPSRPALQGQLTLPQAYKGGVALFALFS